MSGFGERFRRFGYSVPKPLIKVEGQEIISHVIEMFPEETDFLFICNKEHLSETNAEIIIREKCKNATIIGIEPHKKGPVYAVTKILDHLKEDEDIIVNYCDFTCYWDYRNYKDWIFKEKLDGSIPSYKGFHPHSLGNTNYAYIKEDEMRLIQIKEKEPFTNNRMNEYASSGTYHFKNSEIIKHYFNELIKKDINLNGEYYISLVYNLMVKDKLNVGIYELEHFMQWGTPQDVNEYNRWSYAFRNLINSKKNSLPTNRTKGTVIIPMAGRGSRFSNEGFNIPKPLINISKNPMFIQAARSLPTASEYIFICLDEHLKKYDFNKFLLNKINNPKMISIKEVSEGQAITAEKGISICSDINHITISACDHSVLYSNDKFEYLLKIVDSDIIVWISRGHPGAIRNPEMYGWLKCNGDLVTGVSVKEPLSDPTNDPIVIGTFTFKNKGIFYKCLNRLLSRKEKINNEYYIDSMIEDGIKLGLKVTYLEVDSYLCWGTPNDYYTFEYWQSCFDKWSKHPYTKKNDIWLI